MRRLPMAAAFPLFFASALITGGAYGLEALCARLRGRR